MTSLKDLVRTLLDLHGIDRPEPRIAEIAVETDRLLSGLASVSSSLNYHDEPSNYAALMLRETSHD